MTDRETIDIYNARADEYAKLVRADAPDATLAAFIARLPDGARVLDLGCGPGAASAHMAAAGHDPDPLDASEGMIKIARDRFALPARLGDFHDLRGPYDAIWANFSLLHMPRADVPAYLQRLGRELAPGGLMHLGLKTGDGEARDGIGRNYSYFSIAEITTWLTNAGFAPETPRTGTERGLAGTMDAFFTLSAARLPD